MSNTSREDVIKLAREAGFGEMFSTVFCGELEHLYALAVAKAVAEERESIAKWYADEGWLLDEDDIPAAIRARSNT